MFSLSVQISGLNSTSDAPTLQHILLTIRFGPLQTQISVDPAGNGGKRLLLEIQKQQLTHLLSKYAFGMFMENERGRFWSLLSLERVRFDEELSTESVIFYDEHRKPVYKYGITIKLASYDPRLINPTRQHQARLQTTTKKMRQAKATSAKPHNRKIQSFLRGNQGRANGGSSDRKKVIKEAPIRPHRDEDQVHNRPQPAFNNNYFPEADDEAGEGNGVFIPPIMEFTNQEQVTPPFYKKPPIDYAEQPEANQPKFKTFGTIEDFHKETKPKLSQENLRAQRQREREQLRELARKQAQQSFNKGKETEVMIPMPDPVTKTYNLVPISCLSEGQIMEYAQKQKMGEQFGEYLREEERRKKQKAERKQKQKKLQMMAEDKIRMRKELEKQNIGSKKNLVKIHNKISEEDVEDSFSSSQFKDSSPSANFHNRNSPSRHQLEQKQSADDSEAEPLEDDSDLYGDDFESISNAGSMMRSRRSLSQSKKKDEKELNESMEEYGYSQEFDSFSQSRLSRNKRANSISEISDSMMSISNRR